MRSESSVRVETIFVCRLKSFSRVRISQDQLNENMKDQNFNDDVTKILDEAPNARKALMENYDNLLKVAQYCHDNYLESGDSSMVALEETKTFTTQSLASIAYQISTLACSVLSLFDAQTNQLCHMESSINHIGQTVEMHKEKVSRREVGVNTAVRRVPRSHKILPPKPIQPRPLYSRQPINYQQLDGLGHSMKVSGKQSDKTGTIHKHGASIRSNKPPEPVQCPVAPPVISSSFGKPVAPPTIPTTWHAAPEGDIITTLLDEAPPPPPPPPTTNEMLSQDVSPPAPASSGDMVSPSPPPPLPPSHSEALTNHSSPSQGPPLNLETVVEENSFPPPSPPPPPSDDDSFLLLPNDVSELPTPPPPPAPSQEVDVTLPSRRSRRRSPPSTRSLSLRVRSGPASRCHYTRSLFLPAVQSLMIPPPPPYPPPCPPPTSSSSLTLLPCPSYASSPRLCLPARLQHLDLEIPAPPPPLLLDDESGLDDIMPPLPPPVDLDSNAPPHYLEKVVVLYGYEATKPDDLHLTEGEIIYLTHRHDDGWCEGFLNGNKGFFPESYVQLHS
ncbi:ABI family, member 3a isoform X2 [Hippoglossus hippoglossus]|uniref:ABI family, member 3a isoform X2 n=1 Tax=Hippoglossus hippoglossus TaxID=8267 RepID=UPI00148BC3F1|nr:ABI family, member 3a isoform X2 [Hippoglossus hippoglossus]